MDEVADGLFVGSLSDAGDTVALRDNDITSIVSLTYAAPESEIPRGITSVSIPMMDGPQNDADAFEQAVTATRSRLEADARVLVHCSAGASRSPTVAATALALTRDIPLEVALRQVSEARPSVDPHEVLVQRAATVFMNATGRRAMDKE